MAKMRPGTCKRVSLGRGKGTRGLCMKKIKGKWRAVFVKESEYRRRKGLSGKGSTGKKKKKKKKKGTR